MSLAKSGEIKNVCLPNALMTLCEYAEGYGTPELRSKAAAAAAAHLPNIENEQVRALTAQNIESIKNGKRDLYL